MARARDELPLRCLLACAQLAALLAFAASASSVLPTGLPLDDAWIHQVVGRTFAESGTLGYAPGEHGAAATSYLWAALLAFNFKWLHIDPVRWAFALNALATLATGQLLYALLTRKVSNGVESSGEVEVESPVWRLAKLAATLLACTTANVLWFAHSGMEASLFVGLSMTAIWAATAERPSMRIMVVGGWAAALVALTRPEGAPLCGLLVAYVLFRRRGLARVGAALGPALVAGIVYVGSNLARTGRATPTTLSGRKWLWFETTWGLSGVDRATDFSDAWIERLSAYTFHTSRAVAWVLLALAAHGAIRLWRTRSDGLRMLLAWAVLHTVSYLFLLPTPGHGGRYQPFVPLLYSACVALGAAFVVRDVGRVLLRDRTRVVDWLSFAVVLPWIIPGLSATTAFSKAHVLAVAHIDATELETGRFVDTLPLDGTVASFDIGGIGWATRRTVIDAGGLSDPKTASLLERGRIWEYLKSRDVRYVVLPDSYERVLPVIDRFVTRLHLHENPAVRLTRLHEVETTFARWEPGIVATWNAAPRQVVYRIEYTGEQGPADMTLPPLDAHRAVRDDASLVLPRERLVAEHSLAILEAWGIPVSVQVTPAASKATDDPSQACAVRFGFWGIDVAGCDLAGEPELVRSVLYEHVGRYLDARDLAGALRVVPHAIAAAKHFRDARFHPPLAPLLPPNGDAHTSTTWWGLRVFLVILGLVYAIEYAWKRRARATKRARALSPASASAVALLLLVVVVVVAGAATLGCGDARGAKLDARDRSGRTALLAAAAIGDLDAVAGLLARGADTEARDDGGATALHHAARGGHHGCALLLARAGTRLETTAGPRLRTALHDATLAGSADTVRALLTAGSDPRARDAFGETAVHLLARVEPSRVSELVTILLGAGADATVPDARGFTPAHAAAAADNLPMLRIAAIGLSMNETPSGETPVETAMRYGQDRAADLLIRNGASLRSPLAMPPLHEAARTNNVARVATLLAAGADPRASFGSKTPLDVARASGSQSVIALLTPSPQPP